MLARTEDAWAAAMPTITKAATARLDSELGPSPALPRATAPAPIATRSRPRIRPRQEKEVPLRAPKHRQWTATPRHNATPTTRAKRVVRTRFARLTAGTATCATVRRPKPASTPMSVTAIALRPGVETRQRPSPASVRPKPRTSEALAPAATTKTAASKSRKVAATSATRARASGAGEWAYRQAAAYLHATPSELCLRC